MNISLSYFFFKSILSCKNWSGGDELLLLKNSAMDGYANLIMQLICYFTSWIYLALGPWQFGDFSYILRSKKVLPSERGAPSTIPYGEAGTGDCITFIRRLDEGLMLQLLEKKLNFTAVIHLNWLAKIKLTARAPWPSILKLITVVREKY